MGSYIAEVGYVGNDRNYKNGMFTSPYQLQDVTADYVAPRVKAYSGWASYKNNKSGQFNRQLCGAECLSFKGFPQDPGVYGVNIDNRPPPMPNWAAMARANDFYKIYQANRMSNQPISASSRLDGPPSALVGGQNLPAGSYGSKYVNYLNTQSGMLYPQQFVKGNWPSEQLEWTNTPSNGCFAVKEGTPVCKQYY